MKSYEATQSFEVKPGLVITYKAENVSFKVIGQESNKAELEISLSVTPEVEHNYRFDELVEAEYDTEANTITINPYGLDELLSNLINKASKHHRRHRITLSLTAKVPFETEVVSETENGSLTLSGIKGNQTAQSDNGSIKLTKCQGQFNLQTENGSIKIIDSDGNCDLQTENGSSIISNTNGNCNIVTENGSTKINKLTGDLNLRGENGSIKVLESKISNTDIKNENGNIYFEFGDIEIGNFSFENQNGKIHLIIPYEIPYSISASNNWGNIRIGLEGDYAKDKENGKQTITMQKDSGAVKISATNTNGSILLTKNMENHRRTHIHTVFNHGNGHRLPRMPRMPRMPKMPKPFVSTMLSGLDLANIGDIISSSLENLPEEIDGNEIKDKINKKMKKLGEKLSHLNVDDIVSGVTSNIVEELEDEINDEYSENEAENISIKIDKKDIANKISEKLHKLKDKFQSYSYDGDLSEKEKTAVNEQSRLKILQMLQDGKITVEDAERLIRAMEG